MLRHVPTDIFLPSRCLDQGLISFLLIINNPELEYLAVHPDNRGQGIATRLVEHGIAQAKNLRVDLIVMAYKAGVGVYQRLGFETIETLLQDDSQYGGEGEFRVYYMVLRVSK